MDEKLKEEKFPVESVEQKKGDIPAGTPCHYYQVASGELLFGPFKFGKFGNFGNSTGTFTESL